MVTNEKRQAVEPAAKSLLNSGEPSRARTCDPLIKSAFRDTPAGYGSYDLLTFVTGCSRQAVYQLIPINASLSVFWSELVIKNGPNKFPDRGEDAPLN